MREDPTNRDELQRRRMERAALAKLRDRLWDREYREHMAMMDAGEPVWQAVRAYEGEQANV